jgi:hypothetical protein
MADRRRRAEPVAMAGRGIGGDVGKAQMLRSRGGRYRDYQGRTSAFFPLPPKKGAVP